jgi:hypothetical protein
MKKVREIRVRTPEGEVHRYEGIISEEEDGTLVIRDQTGGFLADYPKGTPWEYDTEYEQRLPRIDLDLE